MPETNMPTKTNIICLIGRSSSGKDTIRRRLLGLTIMNIQDLVPATTRPIRVGEADHVDYDFYDDMDVYDADVESGKIMESREYDTSHGIWKYGTPVPKKPGTYVIVSAIDQYHNIRDFIESHPEYDIRLLPFYLYVPEDVLIRRALDREMRTNKDFNEMCRRFHWEHDQYTPDKLKDVVTIENTDIDKTLQQIILVLAAS